MDLIWYSMEHSLLTCEVAETASLFLLEKTLEIMFKKVFCWRCSKTDKDVKEQKKPTPSTGLRNLGNTCYFNSVIQCLYMCDGFRYSLENSLAEGNSANGQLKNVFQLLTSQKDTVNPKKLLDACRPPWFVQGQQQDSSELLRYLLEVLHEEEKSKLPKQEANRNEMSVFQAITCVVLVDDSYIEPKANPTLVQREFTGVLKTTYTCVTCNTAYAFKQNFYDLTLHFPSAAAIHGANGLQSNKSEDAFTLNDLLVEYFKTERLEGEAQFHCNACNRMRDADKTVMITTFPKVLILSIARFSYNFETQTRYKIQHAMSFPKMLIMSSTGQRDETAKSSTKSHQFCLNGINVHKGSSVNSGHYFSFGRPSIPVSKVCQEEQDAFEDQWYKFNDTDVSSVKEFSQVEASSHDSAYLLFYTTI